LRLAERASLPKDSGGWGCDPQPPLSPSASSSNATERSLQGDGGCEQDGSAAVIDAELDSRILLAITFPSRARRE
jgi:hypothetical protein